MHLLLIITSTHQDETVLRSSNSRAIKFMPLEGSISHRIDRFDLNKKGNSLSKMFKKCRQDKKT